MCPGNIPGKVSLTINKGLFPPRDAAFIVCIHKTFVVLKAETALNRDHPAMKYFNKTAFLLLLSALILMSACKKKATPGPTYFMTFKANGKVFSYTSCTESDAILNNVPHTAIVGYYNSTLDKRLKTFQITLLQDENKLQTGQVYTSQSANSLTFNNDVLFSFVPDTLLDYEVTDALYNPTGTVTLTEVTPTSIRGTFTASLYYQGDSYGAHLVYAITEGTFYSNHNTNGTVIQY
jgi:hypothetical protein